MFTYAARTQGTSPSPGGEAKQEKETFAKMRSFFDSTKVSHFKFNSENSLLMDINALDWTRSTLKGTFWRSCYSYILCSIIGAFEAAYKNRIDAQNDPNATEINGMSMALTGVRGTGKSVLGSFIALFMARVFGWQVDYFWGSVSYSFGRKISNQKVIGVMDFSTTQIYNNADDYFFVLFVSSCNSERWKSVARQETWANRGNLIFIDTSPLSEMEYMLNRKIAKEELEKNFNVAGGVPRLCGEPSSSTKEVVDVALRQLNLAESAKDLANLQDPVYTGGGAGEAKFYPGLLLHAVPTDPYRNQFHLEMSSQYVKKRTVDLLKDRQESDIQKLLKYLVQIPEARGFAGIIWEPLFTSKARNGKGKLRVAGAKLPLSSTPEPEMLFDVPLSSIARSNFKTLDDLVEQIKRVDQNGAIFAKAMDDNFLAIDGVLIFVEGSDYVFAGLQMTVARSERVLVEDGVVSFSRFVDRVKDKCNGMTCQKQIWFLQPEECLLDFDFTNMQALAFKEPRYASTGDPVPSSSGRKRRMTEWYGDYKTGEPKNQSNKPEYWAEEAKVVTQYVAIAKFADDHTHTDAESHAKAFVDTMKKSAFEPKFFKTEHPSRRSWQSTMDAFQTLSEDTSVNQDFLDVLREDIESDRRKLVELGEKLAPLPTTRKQ